MRLIHYDVCSFVILSLMILSIFIRKLNNGHAQRLFVAFIMLLYVNTLADIMCAAPYSLEESTDVMIRQVSTYVYFLLHASLMPLYIIFMGSVAGTWVAFLGKSKWKKVVFTAPYLINIAAVATNPWTHWVFYFEDGVYVRGKLVLLTYAIAAFYVAFTIFYLINYKGTLDRGQRLAFFSLYPYTMLAITIQYLYPDQLVEMFAYTVATLTVLMFVIRPEEVINPAVGAKTSSAFKTEMSRDYLSSREYAVIIIKINSDSSLIKLYGINKHELFIKNLVGRIHSCMKKTMKRLTDYDVFYLNYGLIAVKMESKYSDEQMAQRLYETLSERLCSDNFDIVPECVVCALDVPKDFATADELLRFTDTFEKSDIQPGAFIYSKLTRQERLKMNFDIDRYIHKAIANKSFQMYYQPIYSVKEKKFATAEALIRLNDDEVGLISPALFIPAAEKSGAIYEIGDFVIESVFSFIGKVRPYGVKYIEINISAMQCMSSSFVKEVMEKLSRHKLSNKWVNFEITESASDIFDDVLSETVSDLHDQGIEFSIDDYGTGYSNLRRIMSEPIKIIKIDRSLICEINDHKSRTLLADTIRMIKSIGMEIVAEGVEDEQTAHWLIEQGCDYIQGFFYAKPMPENQYIEFLKSNA